MMASRSMPWLVLSCCLLLAIEGMIAKFHNNAVLTPEDVPKPGDFVNCGNKSSETYLTWRPRKLRFGDTAKFNFHVIPPQDLKKGLLKVWAFLPGQTDPMFYSDGLFNCRDILKYVKFIECPFHKNKPVNVKNFKQYIAPSMGFPTGEFFLRLELFTTEGKQLLCLYGHAIVLDD